MLARVAFEEKQIQIYKEINVFFQKIFSAKNETNITKAHKIEYY